MYCPNCNKEYDGRFCPECGTKLIDKPQTAELGINLGDGNAINGSINVTRNDSHNTTSYDQRVINTSTISNITNNIQERQKSEIELLQDRKNLYFNACKRAYEDNVLEQDELVQLESYRVELGLPKDDANKLLDKVRELVNRNATKSELTGIAKIKLKQLSEALKRNEVQALMQQIDSFEALANKFSNDELQYKYFLVLSALKTEKCIEKYETLKADNYWKSFWSCLAYRKKGNTVKSDEILMDLEAFDTFPEDNTLLLGAACALMDGNKAEAGDYLASVVGEFSPALQRFADSIYYLADPAMAQELDVKEEKCAFYLVNFFNRKVVDKAAEAEAKRKAEAEAKRKAEAEAVENDIVTYYNTAMEYHLGINGKKQNGKKAAEWYLKAAEMGLAEAQVQLAGCYERGWGVESDINLAFEWYHKAAEQGNGWAQYALGNLYNQPFKGHPRDEKERVKWYKKAFAQGIRKLPGLPEPLSPEAIAKAAELYAAGTKVTVEKKNNKLTEAKRKAEAEAKRKAEAEDPECLYTMGNDYYFGRNGIKQNYTEAVKYYRKAAEQGHASAQYNLGVCYYWGRGVNESEEEAVKWYRKAAEQGVAESQYNLGVFYYNGQGVNQSYAEAVKWFRKAAEQGHASAQCNLGGCYKNGRGVNESYAEAVKWYRKAVKQGDACAQYNLGVCYYNGQGVNQSDEEAVKWFRKAAEQGHASAQSALKRLE